MSQFERTIEEFKLNKSEWKPVKFGEVAIQQKKIVDRVNSTLTKYIKGEHMVSEDIHIRKWGELKDEYLGPAFIRKFEKGDVLYGSRRTYLRKVAMAHFDGITANTTFVIKANEKKIDKRLLPFVMLSEYFAEHSIRNSKGSVNPYINWKDIANYEFLLPPKDQQAKLAELLWALDEVMEREREVLEGLEVGLNSLIKKYVTSHIFPHKSSLMKVKSPFQTKWEDKQLPDSWKSIRLKEAIESAQGGFAEGKRDNMGMPQLRMNNVSRKGRVDLSSVTLIPIIKENERYLIRINDVLFCNTNSEDLVGKSIIANDKIIGFAYSNHFTRLRPKLSILTSRYLYMWLKYHFDIGLFQSRCVKWIGQAAVQQDTLLNLYIILPTIEEQNFASSRTEKLEKSIELISKKIDSTQSLQKSLINQIF